MFRRVLPLQEPDEVPRRNVDAKRRLLDRRRCTDRLLAFIEDYRLLCTETEVTISSLKRALLTEGMTRQVVILVTGIRFNLDVSLHLTEKNFRTFAIMILNSDSFLAEDRNTRTFFE